MGARDFQNAAQLATLPTPCALVQLGVVDFNAAGPQAMTAIALPTGWLTAAVIACVCSYVAGARLATSVSAVLTKTVLGDIMSTSSSNLDGLVAAGNVTTVAPWYGTAYATIALSNGDVVNVSWSAPNTIPFTVNFAVLMVRLT